MNENKEKTWKTLYNKYPLLFDGIYKSPMDTPMAFGIECGLGWYDLLDSVCSLIQNREQNTKNRLKYEGKDENEFISVKFDQIKEKFGGLRIYYSGGDDYIRGAISMAEEMSYKICEVCGNKGSPNKNGWIHTLCEAHKKS